jgi:signal transduction histidine kinase
MLVLMFALMGPVSGVPASTNEVLSKIVMVRAGGLVVPGPWTTNTSGVMSVMLPKPTRLEISFAPINSVTNEPIRLLRKLEGVDEKWEEAGGQMQVGEMQLMVMIEDASNRILSHNRFAFRNDSEGWRGTLEKSEFLPRRESVLLPAGAKRLRVLLTSQFWTVLGCAAITDFRVFRQDESGEAENIWPDPDIEQGANLDRIDGVPRYWERSSLGRRMAQVLTLPPPAKGHALAIMDDDLHASATWQAELPLENLAAAGETVWLEWREAYSVGIGGRSRATYNPFGAGTYVFRVKTVTPFGEPIGSELALNIFIPQPLWKRASFVIPVVLASAVVMAALVWGIATRRLRTRLERLDYRRRMEYERLRIARDIHDDLGSSLTQISLLSQTAHGKLTSSDSAWQDTERLRTVAVLLTQKLDEIVWAVSPQHDTMESLLSYLTDFAEEFLETAGIRARIHIPLQPPDWVLPSSLRHNLFLSAKEALNNAVKHAGATEIHLRVVITDHAFELTIEDNGCGFTPPPLPAPGANPASRHGLDGMRKRMESLGGEFKVDTAPGRGTRVTFTVPVTGSMP